MTEKENTGEPPKIDKELMKEALHEILNDIPAFWAFVQCSKRGEDRKRSSKGTGVLQLTDLEQKG